MKNQIVFFFSTLLLAAISFASSAKPVLVISGHHYSIDMYDQPSEMTFHWSVPSNDRSAAPEVAILSENNGFECQWEKTTLLSSRYEVNTKTWTQVWGIQIKWSPGADLSGCLIEFSSPKEKSVRVELFMNY